MATGAHYVCGMPPILLIADRDSPSAHSLGPLVQGCVCMCVCVSDSWVVCVHVCVHEPVCVRGVGVSRTPGFFVWGVPDAWVVCWVLCVWDTWVVCVGVRVCRRKVPLGTGR